MHKYADDTYVVVPAANHQSCSSEIEKFEKWSAENNLLLNRKKSVEIVFVARLDGGAEPHRDQCCEEFYRRINYSTIDVALSGLKNRFQSPAFIITRDIEAAVFQALSTDSFPSLYAVVHHFGQDLDEQRLRLHLSMLKDVFRTPSQNTLSVRQRRCASYAANT